MDLKEEHLLGERLAEHWYYVSKGRALEDFLNGIKVPEVLDIGAGSGFFSRWLMDADICQSAICVDPGYAEPIREEQHNNKKLTFTQSLSHVEQELILMMDVLEHVDDDAGLLRDYVSKVSRGTRFFITVPAFQFMWSEHDDFLEHKRRYTLSQLESLVRDADLAIEKGSYYFGLVFPLAFIDRMLSNILPRSDKSPHSHLKQHSRLVNSILSGICKLELPLLRINRFAGLSVFCLARKP